MWKTLLAPFAITLSISGLIAPAIAISQTFKSTNLQAAVITANTTGPIEPGLLWVEPGQGGSRAGGAQIITSDGTLVWRGPVGEGTNFNFQTFNGTKYITYWQGDLCAANGCGFGSVTFLDSTYTQRFNVCIQEPNVVRYVGTPVTQPCVADYHESRLTDRGTLVTTGRTVVQHDLRYLGGPRDGYLLDSIFYEIDIPTNKVLFRWSPLDHLNQYDSLAASQFRLPPGNNATTPQNAWDYWHGNSVARVPSPLGGYLLSSRPLSSIFKLDDDGNIEWVIGGRTGGNFTVPSNAKFQYQHDAVPISATATTLTFSIFNNFNADRKPNLGPSSGLVLTADISKKTVTRNMLFQAPPPIPMSQHGGSTQYLPNKGALVSYGGTNFIQEYGTHGKLVNAMKITGGSSYRAYKYTGWVTSPAAKPAVASFYNSNNDTTSVYMSWNGATEVASWQVSGSKAAKSGFETLINLAGYKKTVQASALSSDGSVLGQSAVVTTSGSP